MVQEQHSQGLPSQQHNGFFIPILLVPWGEEDEVFHCPGYVTEALYMLAQPEASSPRP